MSDDNYCPTCHYELEQDGTCRPCWKDRIYGQAIELALDAKIPKYVKHFLEDALRAATKYD